MYDSLEGLDYCPGECQRYVSKVLENVPASLAKGDLVRKKPEEVQIGDVVVGGFSSHLVLHDDYFPRMTIRQRRSFKDNQVPPVLTIPRPVLERMRNDKGRKSE